MEHLSRALISTSTAKTVAWSVVTCIGLQVNLLQTLPEADRSKERLSELLEDRNLGFLCPLLRIQAELWRQLEADQSPTALYKWVRDSLEPAHHTDHSFISALTTIIVKFISQVNNYNR